MTPERYREVGKVFREAAEIPPDKRAAFLDAACGDDKALREDIESLLVHDSQGKGWIDGRALDVAAQALASKSSKSWVGRQVHHYQVSSLLGRGGMGEVYRARDVKLKRDVAIKLLPDEFCNDLDRVSRFQREAEVLAAQDQPQPRPVAALAFHWATRLAQTALLNGPMSYV